MHARVVTVQLQPGRNEEAIALFRDSVLPSAKQQKGFKGARLLTDSGTGKGIVVTVWESEADLKASESSGYYREQIAKFSGMFAAPPVREIYELNISV
jgi:heme-degrading monooxygenase HmoA